MGQDFIGLQIAFTLTQISCMQIKKLRGRQCNEYAKHGKVVYRYGYVTVHLKQETIQHEYPKKQQFCIKTYEQKCEFAEFKVLLKGNDCGFKYLLKTSGCTL